MTTSAVAVGARSWLGENLFPDAPPPPKLTSRRVLIMFAAAVALVAIQLARMSSSAPLNSLWEQDDGRWLPDATHQSFSVL